MLSAVKLCQSSSISGPVATAKPRSAKNFGQLVHHLADRMDRATRGFGHGQGEVDRFGGQPRIEFNLLQHRLACLDRCGNSGADALNPRSFDLPLLRPHAAERFERCAYPPRLAERGDALHLKRIGIGRRGDRGERICEAGLVGRFHRESH